jgi:endonuclease YncB( thermonuclease family)
VDYTYKVLEIIKVVDGDTIDCRISVGFGVDMTFRFRVFGIDAVEKRDPLGPAATEFSRFWLGRALLIGPLYVTTHKSSETTTGIGDGAFGRWLGDFHNAAGEHLGRELVDAGYAVVSNWRGILDG